MELPAWAPSLGAAYARARFGREGPGWLGDAFSECIHISMIDDFNVVRLFDGMGISNVQTQHAGADQSASFVIYFDLESADGSLGAFFAAVTRAQLATRVGPGGSVCLKQAGCYVCGENQLWSIRMASLRGGKSAVSRPFEPEAVRELTRVGLVEAEVFRTGPGFPRVPCGVDILYKWHPPSRADTRAPRAN